MTPFSFKKNLSLSAVAVGVYAAGEFSAGLFGVNNPSGSSASTGEMCGGTVAGLLMQQNNPEAKNKKEPTEIIYHHDYKNYDQQRLEQLKEVIKQHIKQLQGVLDFADVVPAASGGWRLSDGEYIKSEEQKPDLQQLIKEMKKLIEQQQQKLDLALRISSSDARSSCSSVTDGS